MKKEFLLIVVMMLVANVCRAGINVSTEPECKNVLIEEFTGISCGYCPQAHKIVADLIKVQPENVFAIAVHAGQFARPNSDEPDFRTSEGTEINDFFGISGYPAGMVNRQRVDDRITISRYSWATFSRQLMEELAPVNLWMESTYDDATRTLTVNVEGYYTADVDAQSNYLNVVLTQNNIMGPQKGAGMGSEYMHQHMARKYLTSTWGDEISSCKKGDFFSKQYVYTLPSDIKEVEVNPAEIEVVVFVTEDKENVLNVIGGHPELVGMTLPLAAEIAQPLIPMNGTWGYDYFEFDLTNKSSEAITSATFNVSFNSVDYTVEWSGVVDPRSTATIRLPFDVAGLSKATNNKYVIKTTALNGTEFTSNKLADKFNAPLTITPTVMVEYCLDDYADENHIVIKDMDGNVVKEFGPYEAGELAYIVTKEMASLEANTRYCLEVTDAWANGIYEGYLNLYDANNTLVEEFKRIEEHGVRVFFNTVASNASTEVQKKKVFLEDFTGIHCGNCPDAHYRITELLKAQGDKVYATAIHAGHYAEPFPDEPDFRTPQGDSLDIYFETPGYPSGMINRTIFDGETEPMTARNKWVEYARLICDQDAPVNLWLSSVYNPDSHELTVVVEGYYTADVDADFNMLNILITQSGIRGPQNGGNAGNNYIHEHVARVYLTPVWGDTIASCKQGDTFKKQYVYVVPNDINGVATDIANSEVLAYVCKDKTDILNVIGVHPEYPGLVIPMNAEIQQPLIPITGTYAYNYYEVLFKNNSTEDVVSAGFEINLNDTKYTTEWTGLVPARSTALIQVPFNQSALIKSANDFTLKLTSINNQTYKGNSISGDFQDPVETTPFNKFVIKTDTYADENRYLIKDMAGKVVHEFGPYPLGVVTEVTEELMLDKDQTYCLEITDAWGNGIYIPRGTCKIYNAAGKLVSQLLEIKDHGIRSFFTTSVESAVEAVNADNAYIVQYNKANKAIQVVANGNETYNVAVYNAAGQCVYATQANASISAPVSVEGVYVVEVTSATAHEVAKVAVY